jgi:hypothetical protein
LRGPLATRRPRGARARSQLVKRATGRRRVTLASRRTTGSRGYWLAKARIKRWVSGSAYLSFPCACAASATRAKPSRRSASARATSSLYSAGAVSSGGISARSRTSRRSYSRGRTDCPQERRRPPKGPRADAHAMTKTEELKLESSVQKIASQSASPPTGAMPVWRR